MSLEESEEYIQVLKDTNEVLAETNQTLRERVDYLQRNLKVVEKSLEIALELKAKYYSELIQSRDNKTV